MNQKLLGAAIGLTVLAASTAASAHVDLSIGLGLPGVYAAPAPVYVAPPPPPVYAPVAVGYRDYNGWRGDDGWREREWRRREWREHQWRDHGDRGDHGGRGRWGD